MILPARTQSPTCSMLAGLVCLAAAAGAHAADPIPVESGGTALFANYLPRAARNISGATCFATGNCLLVADERIAIQSIDLDTNGGRVKFQPGQVHSALFDRWCRQNSKDGTCTKQEVDLEGIARSADSVVVTGSMGNRRKSGNKARLRWFIARFSVGPDGNPVRNSLRIQSDRPILRQLFNPHSMIAPFAELPLQCGGLNIEGLAQIGSDLFFGLRSPQTEAEARR